MKKRQIRNNAIVVKPAELPSIPESFMRRSQDRAFAPHCDTSILHAPGFCEYCDDYSDWQSYRELARINFTGQNDESKAPCPSTHFRCGHLRDQWPGNRAIEYEGSFR